LGASWVFSGVVTKVKAGDAQLETRSHSKLQSRCPASRRWRSRRLQTSPHSR
jgi:hypothetical protein